MTIKDNPIDTWVDFPEKKKKKKKSIPDKIEIFSINDLW